MPRPLDLSLLTHLLHHHSHTLLTYYSAGRCGTIRKRGHQRANQEFPSGTPHLRLLYSCRTLTLHLIDLRGQHSLSMLPSYQPILATYPINTPINTSPSQANLSTPLSTILSPYQPTEFNALTGSTGHISLHDPNRQHQNGIRQHHRKRVRSVVRMGNLGGLFGRLPRENSK